MNEADLCSKLIEDTGSSGEAERMLPVVRRLGAWLAPEPDQRQTMQLLTSLRSARAGTAPTSRRRSRLLFWNLLLSQVRVMHPEIWAASALVMLLGTALTLAYSVVPSSHGPVLPFVLIAPIVSAVGVAFLYGSMTDPALEIELALPIPAGALLLARLVLVYGFNLALGLAASITLTALNSKISFWPLVGAWLAPMTFLSALAFLLTTLTREPGLGMLVSMTLWTVQGVKALRLISIAWPDLTAAGTHVWLWSLAAAMGAFALWVGGCEEHWLNG